MPFLSEPNRGALLGLARRAIVEAVTQQQPATRVDLTGIFAEQRGVFVTLRVRGRLRGCIGVVEPFEPLGMSVARCAASAALDDPRFAAVCSDEIPLLQIELSLLSVPAPLRPEEIEIGKHGLLITQGSRRGLLLPQVAVEHKLSPEKFLEETCRKAGLPPNAWREPETRILGFTCEVFSESNEPA